MINMPNRSPDWDAELQRLAVAAEYWRDVAARGDADTAESAGRMVRVIEQCLRALRHCADGLGSASDAGAGAPAEQPPRAARPCPRPARRRGHGRQPAPVRTAVAEQLRRAEGWPLSTVELCTRLGRHAGGYPAVYAALRSLADAELCVRLRDTSALGSRAVYWCTPDSPFATGWGEHR